MAENLYYANRPRVVPAPTPESAQNFYRPEEFEAYRPKMMGEVASLYYGDNNQFDEEGYNKELLRKMRLAGDMKGIEQLTTMQKSNSLLDRQNEQVRLAQEQERRKQGEETMKFYGPMLDRVLTKYDTDKKTIGDQQALDSANQAMQALTVLGKQFGYLPEDYPVEPFSEVKARAIVDHFRSGAMKTVSEKEPYVRGSMHEFYEGGKKYQGTYAGLDANGAPVWNNKQLIPASSQEQKTSFDQENKLRDEFIAQNKDFRAVRDAYSRINASAKEPSAAGDLALIFNYMKLLDPGSVVREGEFATAQNAAGIPERVRANYNRVVNGERLTEETRKDFLKQAKNLYGSQENQYKKSRKEYERITRKYGLNPETVLVDQSANMPESEVAPPAAPAPAATSQVQSIGRFKVRVKGAK